MKTILVTAALLLGTVACAPANATDPPPETPAPSGARAVVDILGAGEADRPVAAERTPRSIARDLDMTTYSLLTDATRGYDPAASLERSRERIRLIGERLRMLLSGLERRTPPDEAPGSETAPVLPEPDPTSGPSLLSADDPIDGDQSLQLVTTLGPPLRLIEAGPDRDPLVARLCLRVAALEVELAALRSRLESTDPSRHAGGHRDREPAPADHD